MGAIEVVFQPTRSSSAHEFEPYAIVPDPAQHVDQSDARYSGDSHCQGIRTFPPNSVVFTGIFTASRIA